MPLRILPGWGRGLRNRALASLAVFLALLMTFPNLPLPFYRASMHIPYGSSSVEPAMPGADTDGDGLYDNIERRVGTSPIVADSDADGLPDGDEYRYWTQRAELEARANQSDPWLAARFPSEGRSRLVQRYRPDRDLEGDGLTNLRDADSDGDRIMDGRELLEGTDPAHPDLESATGPGTGAQPPSAEPLPPLSGPPQPGPDEQLTSSNLETAPLDPWTFQRVASEGSQVLFYIEPPDRPRYWRTTAYDRYENSSWCIMEPGNVSYTGQPVPQEVARPPELPEDEYRVSFNGDGSGYLPSALHTTRLHDPNPEVPITLDRLGNFHTLQAVKRYNFTTFIYPVAPGELENATLSPDMLSSEYVRVRGEVPLRVRSLALTLSQGNQTPLQKVSALLAFLKSSCSFIPAPELPHWETDMVDNFLFVTRRGSSLEFASAFVLLCRYSGIPSRLVTGFALGDVVGERRAVRAAHFHAWGEVHFEELGWVQFETSNSDLQGLPGVVGAQGTDPTVGEFDTFSGKVVIGGGGGGTTRNESGGEQVGVINGSMLFTFDVQPSVIEKGGFFRVEGTLATPVGVSGCATVSVFMDETSAIVGKGRSLPDGSFSILCSADSLPVGERDVGMAAFIFHRGILYTAETLPQQMKSVTLVSSTTIQIQADRAVVTGEELFYAVSLRDVGGLPPPRTEKVSVHWRGAPLEVLEVGEGLKKSSFKVTDPPGRYELTVSFNGSRYLFPTCRTVEVSVKSAALRIDVTTFPPDPIAGGQLFVRARLESDSGEPFIDNVTISWDGEHRGSFRTGAVATLDLPGDKVAAGDHHLTVAFKGNDIYMECLRQLDVRVRGTSRIFLPTGSISLGKERELVGHLMDNMGLPISGAAVQVRWREPSGEERSREVATFSAGDFRVKIQMPESAPVGMLALSADFHGSGYYAATSNTTHLPVTSPSRISAVVGENLTRGGAVGARGRLEDHLGSPIEGACLTLELEGELCGVGWTDPTGLFEIAGEVPMTQRLGEATVVVSYPGEGYQEGCALRAGVAVHSRCYLNLSIPSRLEQGGGFEAVVLLTDDREEPVAGHNLTVRFAGISLTRATDPSGRARFQLSYPWLTMREELRVSYGGEEYRRPVSLSVSLAAEPVVFYRLVAVVAVLATLYIGYWTIRKYGLPLRRRGEGSGPPDLSWLTDKYRRTIRKVYARMVSEMRDIGAPRDMAWTVREYEVELGRLLRLDLHSLHLLTTVFEEARYSRHRFTNLHSRRAVLSYRRLMNSLSLERVLGPGEGGAG